MGAVLEQGFVLAGRYRLLEQVGAGGMGVVWRAEDQLLERDVALKWITFAGLTSQDAVAQARRRTMVEARAAARLRNHPQVIAIYDVIDEGDVWVVLVLEYLPSRSLDHVLTDQGRLDPAEVARIGAAVAGALAAGHAAGIVHRDVKPGNVLIGTDESVKLTDFGISHVAGETRLTQTGQFTGTVAYSAPEWARDGTTTAASDVFSLGSTLYAAVEGLPPFGTDDNVMRLMGVVRNGIIRPPVIAGPLEPLLLRLLQINPDTRPDAATASDQLAQLAQRLSASADGAAVTALPRTLADGAAPAAVQATPPTGRLRSALVRLWARIARRVTRRAALVVGVVLVILAAGGVLTGVLTRGEDPLSAPDAPIAGLPTQIGYVALPSDPRTADPCQLVDIAGLKAYGNVTVAGGFNLESCLVVIDTGAAHLRVQIAFSAQGTDTRPLRRPDADLGGVVLRSLSPSATSCASRLRLSDGSGIVVSADNNTAAAAVDLLCRPVDTAAAGAARVLADRGLVPTDPNRLASMALGGLNACDLLDRQRLPDVAQPARPGYASWSCGFGPVTPGKEQVTIALQFGDPIPAPSAATLGRYRARLGVRYNGVVNPSQCGVIVEYRTGSRLYALRNESVSVSVDGPGEQTLLCARAKTVAEGVAAKLPPPPQ